MCVSLWHVCEREMRKKYNDSEGRKNQPLTSLISGQKKEREKKNSMENDKHTSMYICMYRGRVSMCVCVWDTWALFATFRFVGGFSLTQIQWHIYRLVYRVYICAGLQTPTCVHGWISWGQHIGWGNVNEILALVRGDVLVEWTQHV